MMAGLGFAALATSGRCYSQRCGADGLPTWVRARGLSIFMIVFNGTMALGSFVWGVVATMIGIPAVFVLSALCLFGFDLVTPRWRIPGDDALVPAIGEPIAREQKG
jgi:MFS family permease